MTTNPNAVNGDDQVLKIHDGQNPGTHLKVEYQGDADYQTGVKQNLKRTKTGSLPFQSKDGATLTVSVTKTRPRPAGQRRLWDVANSGELTSVEYVDPNSGGDCRAGMAQISMGGEKAGVNDTIEVEFTIAFVDDPENSVTP